MGSLEDMLPQVAVLKSYFGIGTRQAYNYLKSKESYSNLMNLILERSSADTKPSSVLEVSNVSESLKNCVHYLVQNICEVKSSAEGLCSMGYFVSSYGHHGKCQLKRVGDSEYFDEEREGNLELDYPLLMNAYYLFRDKGMSHNDSINSVMEFISNRNVPCLNKGDKSYSISDFLEGRVDYSTGEEDEYARDVREGLFKGEESLPEDDLIITEEFEGDETHGPVISGKLPIEDILELSEHPGVESISVSDFDKRGFETSLWMHMENSKLIPSNYNPFIRFLDGMSSETSEFLLGRDYDFSPSIYDRLERDGKLYDIHNERKISLIALLEYHNLETEDVHIGDFIDHIVLDLKERIDKTYIRLERMKKACRDEGFELPDSVGGREEKVISERKYLIRSLEGNRKWLSSEFPNFFRSKQFL